MSGFRLIAAALITAALATPAMADWETIPARLTETEAKSEYDAAYRVAVHRYNDPSKWINGEGDWNQWQSDMNRARWNRRDAVTPRTINVGIAIPMGMGCVKRNWAAGAETCGG